MPERVRQRQEWQFFRTLPQASRPLAVAWWVVVLLGGALPVALALATGALAGAVQEEESLVLPLVAVGAVFVVLQTLSPLQQAISANLGDKMAAHLYDRLTAACVEPPGIGHLEDPSLTADLSLARDFDLGITGPPLFIEMDFIAVGLVQLVAGLISTVILFGYTWWAPIVLAGAWIATHILLRESVGLVRPSDPGCALGPTRCRLRLPDGG
ncbi:MAG TPA: hypothetical protein PKI89_06730 [Tepidiformaceae bacterium]|nr:hypothetical protein [Tepidiformaceae bacterium]